MKRYYYIRIYFDDLQNTIRARLPDWLWRRMHELELIAGNYGKDGLLPPLDDVAYLLRLGDDGEDRLRESLLRLADKGLAKEIEEGWMMTTFVQRQGNISGAERQKQYLLKKKDEAVDAASHVTERHINSITVFSNSNSGSVSEGEGVQGEGEKNVFDFYEQEIDRLTPFLRDALIDAVKTYSAAWVKDAISVAVLSNVRRWNYIAAILERWRVEGRREKRKQEETTEKVDWGLTEMDLESTICIWQDHLGTYQDKDGQVKDKYSRFCGAEIPVSERYCEKHKALATIEVERSEDARAEHHGSMRKL